MIKRRHFVLGGAAVIAGGYINSRGLRYPRLNFEPRPIDLTVKGNNFNGHLKDAICVTTAAGTKLRAISPEPSIHIQTYGPGRISFRLENIASSAQLKVDGAGIKLHESTTGINRQIEIEARGTQKIKLAWFLPEREGSRFAVIGDTGAGLELEWCLQRANYLGAQFLLHLGDFNYAEGEYERAVELFSAAPLPCYVTIGNHDFNDSGLIYERFLQQIGPLNHKFSFAGTQFINIDTALDFFPAHSGLRGAMLNNIEAEQGSYFDQVCFTHRNFLDPRPGKDHTIGRSGERKWLADKLQSIGADHILTGHVHKSAEMEYRGLKQFTVGEGLAFDDIINQRQVAQLLIGTIEMGRKVSYSWHPITMPWAMHTSPKHEEKLLKEYGPSELKWYKNKLASS